jgi:hypothetical protein
MTADACLAFLWKGDRLALIMTLTIWLMVFSKVLHSNMWVSGYHSLVDAPDCISDDSAHFTWPTAAYGGHSHGTRPCSAVLHDMMTVEAAHIAYGCVEVCLHSRHA